MLSFDVSFQEIFSTLCGGGCLHLIDPGWRQDAPALLDQLDSAGIERIFMPYVALQLLAEHAVRWAAIPRGCARWSPPASSCCAPTAIRALVRRAARRPAVQPLRPQRDPRGQQPVPGRRPGALAGPARPSARPVANHWLRVVDARPTRSCRRTAPASC